MQSSEVSSTIVAPAPPLHIVTPLLKSRKLSSKMGASVWLKLESVQTSGSFKSRGLGRLCQKVKQTCISDTINLIIMFMYVAGAVKHN